MKILSGFTVVPGHLPLRLPEALIEWRDARHAIFDAQFDISDASKARWNRLAQAEHDLMTIARELP